MNEFDEYKGKKLRVSTNRLDFEGTLTGYRNGYLTLEDSYQVFDYTMPDEYRRRRGKAHISVEDVVYYGEVI